MLLDNPVWHSLNFLHSHLASGTPLAKRYLTEVTRAVAIADHSRAALRDLAQIVISSVGTFHFCMFGPRIHAPALSMRP
jgi:hypothetical protein